MPYQLSSFFGQETGLQSPKTFRLRTTDLSSLGVLPWGGHPQGAPLPVFSRRFALGRAPTRGAPTDCLLSAFGPGEGTHKGRPYRLSSLGALGRAPTRGAPTDCLLSAFGPGEGTHKGAPTDCLLSAFGPGEGTHKGCPYRLSSLGVRPWGGHPQGVPLPIVFSRPLPIVFSAFGPGEGAHKGALIVFSRRSALGGHPQGVPLPAVFSRRSALGRAPTRGAPTGCLLAAFGPGEGTHKGRPYRLSSLGVRPWGGHPQGAPLPIVFSRRLLRPWGGHP